MYITRRESCREIIFVHDNSMFLLRQTFVRSIYVREEFLQVRQYARKHHQRRPEEPIHGQRPSRLELWPHDSTSKPCEK